MLQINDTQLLLLLVKTVLQRICCCCRYGSPADEPTHSKSGGQVENYKEKRFQYSSEIHFRTTYFIIWLLAQALMT